MSSDQDITVLAPTDDAFAALPKGTVEELLKAENRDKLTAILSLHAIPGKVSAGDALNAGNAKALGGGTLKFNVVDGVLKVNGATIVKTDIKCDNGIIHVIDAVILSSSKGGEDKTASSSSGKPPLEQIEDAIDRGVPIFNSGDHGACASIYRDCMVSIAEASCVDSRVSMVIKQLVKRAGSMESDTERAWVLRSGLDHVYTALSSK